MADPQPKAGRGGLVLRSSRGGNAREERLRGSGRVGACAWRRGRRQACPDPQLPTKAAANHSVSTPKEPEPYPGSSHGAQAPAPVPSPALLSARDTAGKRTGFGRLRGHRTTKLRVSLGRDAGSERTGNGGSASGVRGHQARTGNSTGEKPALARAQPKAGKRWLCPLPCHWLPGDLGALARPARDASADPGLGPCHQPDNVVHGGGFGYRVQRPGSQHGCPREDAGHQGSEVFLAGHTVRAVASECPERAALPTPSLGEDGEELRVRDSGPHTLSLAVIGLLCCTEPQSHDGSVSSVNLSSQWGPPGLFIGVGSEGRLARQGAVAS